MRRRLKALTEIGMHLARELCTDIPVETRLEAETLRDVPIDTLGSEAVIAAADSPKRREPSPTDQQPYVAKTPPSRCHPLPLLRPSAACPLPIGCQGAAELLPAAAESCQRGQRLTQ
jgi:hypothetical protein